METILTVLTRLAPIAAIMLLGSAAQAQTAGTVTLTANQTSAQGSLTPVLTWSTSPVASSCTASGAWSGTKFASGSETLAKITANASYTLTCSWNNGSTTVSWTAPTQNTDGSALTDLASFKVAYGRTASALTETKLVNDAYATSAVMPALQSGTWFFAVRAVNAKQVESDTSNVASANVTAASAANTVNIAVTPAPPPVQTLKTTRTNVYDVVFVNNVRTRGQIIGTIALGKACDNTYQVPSTSYWRVTRTDVKITVTPRSNSVVARCEIS